jgi:hypothetical protein
MKKFLKIIFPFVICLLFSTAHSQVIKTFPQGIGSEIGLGYNQLRHHVHSNPPLNESYTFYREVLYLTPTVRMSYELYPQAWLPVRAFIGYDVSGGKSEKQPNGYEDKYTFRQIELGITVSYNYQNFEVGAGIKYNIHLKVLNEHYGSINDLPGAERTWQEEDVSDLFSKNSTDLGLRISYKISKFLIAGEAWFGISNLEDSDFDDYVDVVKNRFLFLAGYQL